MHLLSEYVLWMNQKKKNGNLMLEFLTCHAPANEAMHKEQRFNFKTSMSTFKGTTQ